MNIKNISGNIASVIVLLHMVYPGIDGPAIVQAFMDGSWIGHAINIALAYFLYKAGKPVGVYNDQRSA